MRTGTPLEYGTPRFNDIVASEGINIIPGTRSIVLVDIHQVGTSCGFSMPCYDFVSFRPTLNDFFEKRVKSEKEGKWEDGLERLVVLESGHINGVETDFRDRYWAYKNAWSMDGLPGLQRGVATGAKDKVKPMKKMVGRYAPMNGERRRSSRAFTSAHLILAMLVGLLISMGAFALLLRFGYVAVYFKKEIAGVQWEGLVRG